MAQKVRTGLDRLVDEGFSGLKGKRIALLAHQPSVDATLRHIIDHLREADDVELIRVFAPEHGFGGAVQDQVGLGRQGDLNGIPLVTLYGDGFSSLRPRAEELDDIDLLLADIQDIGSRYYTYFNTLAFTMERAVEAGVPVMILDRPNPINGIDMEGPILSPEMRSFVGYYAIPPRHGLTVGELARLVKAEFKIGAEIEVLPMEGWRREMYFDETGLPWVMPSPNIPSLDTALVYPGACLLEGTNLSEGRGTTRPFEIFGAPFLDGKELVHRLNALSLPGAAFREASFIPTFHKWAGEDCSGLQVHVIDRKSFKPWLTFINILLNVNEMHEDFAWREDAYEFESDRPAIDLLLGEPALRMAIEDGREEGFFAGWNQDSFSAYEDLRKSYLLYPEY